MCTYTCAGPSPRIGVCMHVPLHVYVPVSCTLPRQDVEMHVPITDSRYYDVMDPGNRILRCHDVSATYMLVLSVMRCVLRGWYHPTIPSACVHTSVLVPPPMYRVYVCMYPLYV